MNKTNPSIDLEQLVFQFKTKAEEVLVSFMHYIAGISPNRVDMNKVRSLMIAGKSVKEHEKSGVIMINMNGQRSIRIDSLDALAGPKLYKPMTTALMEAGMTVTENGTSLIATMQQLTEDMRKEIAKQIRTSKENYKQSLNNLRADMHKTVKNAKASEDVQNRIKNEIDKIKEKVQKSLDTECSNKEKAVMSS